VLAGGNAYIANVKRAASYAPVTYESIRSIHVAQDKQLLVLATETDVFAYGVGEKWRGRVCLDELRIDRVLADDIEATCWDPRYPERHHFRISLESGASIDYEMP
jgi:hypothetical protein